MEIKWRWQGRTASILAILRVILRARWQIGKLVVLALSLVAAFVVLPRYYWIGGFPVFAQVVGWVAVVGGTGFLAMIMAADAASER